MGLFPILESLTYKCFLGFNSMTEMSTSKVAFSVCEYSSHRCYLNQKARNEHLSPLRSNSLGYSRRIGCVAPSLGIAEISADPVAFSLSSYVWFCFPDSRSTSWLVGICYTKILCLESEHSGTPITRCYIYLLLWAYWFVRLTVGQSHHQAYKLICSWWTCHLPASHSWTASKWSKCVNCYPHTSLYRCHRGSRFQGHIY